MTVPQDSISTSRSVVKHPTAAFQAAISTGAHQALSLVAEARATGIITQFLPDSELRALYYFSHTPWRQRCQQTCCPRKVEAAAAACSQL